MAVEGVDRCIFMFFINTGDKLSCAIPVVMSLFHHRQELTFCKILVAKIGQSEKVAGKAQQPAAYTVILYLRSSLTSV